MFGSKATEHDEKRAATLLRPVYWFLSPASLQIRFKRGSRTLGVGKDLFQGLAGEQALAPKFKLLDVGLRNFRADALGERVETTEKKFP